MINTLTPRIAIIGAGSAGLAVLNELFRVHGGTNLPSVHLVDGGTTSGAGSVFADDLDCALVNRQARHMSVDYDNQRDFLDWLATHPDPPQGVDGEYYTRAFFGRYLADRFAEVERRWSEAGAPVERVQGYVSSVEEVEGAVLVRVDADILEFDHLVLCTGHGRQDRGETPASAPLPPYPLRALVARTAGQTRIAVMGAGLTAVDCAMALVAAEPDRVVSLFSRTGILPDVRADHEEDLPLHHSPRQDSHGATLAELKARFRVELSLHGVTEDDLDSYLARLRRGVSAFVEAAPVPQSHRQIQNIAISLANRDLPTFWYGFSEDDRATLVERHYRLLQAVCSPIPPRTARLLREALVAGRIEVAVGTASRDLHGWVVRTETGERRFDVVIDGTGESTSSGQEAFERSLVATGGAVESSYGGLSVDRDTGLLLRADGRQSRVHALGFVTRGALFYSSSLYQATRNAQGIAQHLCTVAGPALRLDMSVTAEGA